VRGREPEKPRFSVVGSLVHSPCDREQVL